MALIKCSECGKEISDKAKVCPNCGNPLEENVIKVFFEKPKNLVVRSKCFLYDENEELLWSGQMEETAAIKTDSPLTIMAKVNGFFGKPTIQANPGDLFIVGSNALGKIQFRKTDKDFSNRENGGTWGSLFQ